MNKKRSDLKSAPGLISSECWWKESSNTAGFSLVSKWDDRDSFKNWMKESHKDGHKRPKSSELKITKTLYQFEPVE